MLIEIEYLIPENSCDGIPLINDDFSYSKSQNEYIINQFSLFKVIDILQDKENNTAHIKMMLIPKNIWDKEIELKNNHKR